MASSKGRGDIAIVGMACLYPGADSPQRLFSNILGKLEFLREPLAAWRPDDYLGSRGSNRVPTTRGGFLGETYRANPLQFGVTPASVDGSDPDHFLALDIAHAALADAGLAGPGHDHERTGIVLGHSNYLQRGGGNAIQHGVAMDQTRALLGQLLPGADPAVLDKVRDALQKRLPPFNSDIAPGLVPNVMTGRIANRLDFRGPNYLIDAACSASLLAVQAGMEELRAGKSDLMLAGGVNASITGEVYMVFHQLGALSQAGHVRPFMEGGDGTLMGEGLGVLALRRLEDAEARGERIYAVLRGLGQSSDGRGGGLLAPRLEGEMLAIRRAREDAGSGDEPPPGLIEAHGTGIPLGDRTEINALRGIFGERAETGLPVTAIGSLKSMIGHCIPAAGAAGLIKTSLALYHKILPPTLGTEVRGELPFPESPLYVNTAARPWVSASPRTAGVNAFGFGGINSHAVLQEHAGPAKAPSHWPVELICLAAETPTALAEAARHLARRIEAHPRAPLAAIAAHAVRGAGRGPARLALVATSRDDAAEKLGKAADRLDGGKESFRIRSGIFAAAAPSEGKLAFLFTGEGAQYQGMLGELLMHFPEAREWFDFWDGLFPDRALPPSASVFPPPTTLSRELEEHLVERLFGLELGSESVFIAAQALMAVMERLGLTPDAVLGHSSGEHAALAAAGVMGETGSKADRAEFRTRIRDLNKLYQEIEAAGGIEGGALLTVGGVPRARILELVEAEEGLHLALDNCEHQAVLYGSQALMDRVAATLRSEGAITAFLPFDRPYHTPLFGDVAAKVREVYRAIGFKPARLPIYSCASAGPMPEAPAEIEDKAAEQWASRVRFTETVQRLYDDGARLFIEIGPSANLTGFAEDVLKGKGAQCLALDSRRQGGLAYFLKTIGQVWVAGREMRPQALFEGRELPAVDLEAEPPKDRAMFINNAMPYARIPDDEAAALSAELMASLGLGGAQAAPVATPQTVTADAPQAQPAPAAAETAPEVIAAGTPLPGAQDSLGGHFALMQHFLDTAGNVMEAALGGGAPVSDTGEWQPPLLHRITEQTETRLVAESDFYPKDDPFIADHVLYAFEVSDLDPSLQALPVLPLAVSLEIVCEAATLLTGAVPNALENVRARDWVAFDHGPETLTIEAEVTGDSRVAVKLRRGEALLFEAEAVSDGAGPLPALPPLTERRASTWDDAMLYQTGMFHGALFQCVASIEAWDGHGIDARLADAPLAGFIGDGTPPEGLLLNPALLDQVGHGTAFWVAMGLGTDFSSFPSAIARIELPDARREDTAGALLAGRLAFRDAEDRPQERPEGARFMQGDFDVTAPDGTMLLQVRGWRDRFFDVPHAFYEARYRPRDAFYGAAAPGLFPGAPADVTIWQVPAFPPGFLEDAGGIWTRVLATTVLSEAERETFRSLTGPAKRRRDWLTGRVALKEAVRAHLAAVEGVLLLPADIEILTEEGGRPFVNPEPLATLGVTTSAPEITLAHSGGAALAAAAPAGRVIGIDMEVEAGVDAGLLANGAFAEGERALLGEGGLLFGWCAKEAAAKAYGQGLNGRPQSFALTAFGGADASVTVPGAGPMAVQLARDDGRVMALALG
ncbi:beta-ketoacyl synthase N-terminal-like domain-containing protein [Pseudoroseicyclus sp. H15]